MATTAFTPPSPKEVLPRWLDELRASDRAKGTIRRYKSAVEGFLSSCSSSPNPVVSFLCSVFHATGSSHSTW